jgi:hypothetical protein
LTPKKGNAALRLLLCVIGLLDAERVADSRQKIGRYLESLASAGHCDAKQLTRYGLAYLKELHEGRDRRFTGC